MVDDSELTVVPEPLTAAFALLASSAWLLGRRRLSRAS